MNFEDNISILLIEDDDIDAECVRRSLPKCTALHRASTLQSALAVLSDMPLDLILLDPGLPDSSGVDSFLRIRESSPELPIVVLTGFQDKELAVQIIRLGAQDYLLKDQLDERAMQALRFAVERGRLLRKLEDEQAQREQLASKLREQEQSLAHLGRVALMGELVAEITHEVSQPLNVISALVGALEVSHQQSVVDTAQNAILIKNLSDANLHAGAILQRLREFIRDKTTTFDTFDIKELIISTIDFVDSERRRRKITIKHDFTNGRLFALGNTTQIQQVIVNLLRNAFDAMMNLPESNRLVTVRAYQQDSTVCVEVIDQGSGLELETAAAFSAFKTTKSEGLGMGLAICSRILHNHHGRITHLPSDRPGSTFRFELPSS
ncbi:sensor histidine kinase [Rubripirellula reticaptiva]|uniref:histidine kinase n=1 Tax=Rubripirellula reticaptiva TaxID=2528013 RepID=A0A5C6ESJ4_9BACT|nr:ATP-binding protein [Rubripirellula reticaptiva]TWU51992.1 Sensor protein FixL [Rubripirellula reticaptiva]